MIEFNELQNKYMELDIEFNTINQRLMLKEDIEKMERSALHRAQES
jgi:hypothetical protein